MNPSPIDKTERARKRIADGLGQCIVDKGYAQTKLIDVADACNTSPPFIRYYFKNKESILEYQYVRVVQQFENAVAGLDQDACGAWLRSLVELIFNDHPAAQKGLLILMEANLVMARSAEMIAVKRRYDGQVMAAMAAKLSTIELADNTTPEQLAAAFFDQLSGLMTKIAVDPEFGRAEAIERFCFVAQGLTGLDEKEFNR